MRLLTAYLLLDAAYLSYVEQRVRWRKHLALTVDGVTATLLGMPAGMGESRGCHSHLGAAAAGVLRYPARRWWQLVNMDSAPVVAS